MCVCVCVCVCSPTRPSGPFEMMEALPLCDKSCGQARGDEFARGSAGVVPRHLRGGAVPAARFLLVEGAGQGQNRVIVEMPEHEMSSITVSTYSGHSEAVSGLVGFVEYAFLFGNGVKTGTPPKSRQWPCGRRRFCPNIRRTRSNPSWKQISARPTPSIPPWPPPSGPHKGR